MGGYISRTQAETIKSLAKWFPIVSVTGPRQSGKSTLLKHAFSSYKYINLEEFETRRRAEDDPVGFIRDLSSNVIIDEAQLVPELFRMVQVVCDEQKIKGRFILSGSQNFLLSKNIGQSLAGRVGISRLLPLSFQEAYKAKSKQEVDDFIFTGGYPQLHSDDIPRKLFFQNYIDTYLERDVKGYLDVRNRSSFNQLLFLLAERVGSLINFSELANTLDVSFQTIKSWVQILEASYIIFFLQPYHAKTNKRLTKTPKVFFWDSGLLSYLLGFTTTAGMVESASYGHIFENAIIAEKQKMYLNAGEKPILYFYNDDSKREIDLLDFTSRKALTATEIKSSRSYKQKFARHLNSVGGELGISIASRNVVCRVESSCTTEGIKVVNAKDWLLQR